MFEMDVKSNVYCNRLAVRKVVAIEIGSFSTEKFDY